MFILRPSLLYWLQRVPIDQYFGDKFALPTNGTLLAICVSPPRLPIAKMLGCWVLPASCMLLRRACCQTVSDDGPQEDTSNASIPTTFFLDSRERGAPHAVPKVPMMFVYLGQRQKFRSMPIFERLISNYGSSNLL